MKKHLFFPLLILLAGAVAGYFFALIETGKPDKLLRQRERLLQIRTEEYEPSCRQLQAGNSPTVVSNKDDYFIIIPRDKDFIVFGLNAKGDMPPVTAWWSAGLKQAIEQACRDRAPQPDRQEDTQVPGRQ